MKWDFYYFCFSVGMSNKKLVSHVKLTDTDIIIDDSYLPFQYELVAALVSTEIERKGLKWSKENITSHFMDLTDPVSIFSSRGEELLNYYAEGGFREIMSEQPDISDPVEFILTCKKVIGEDVPMKE